jgi:bifunctional DNA-binding transcriptional regulator/antitoxin component of YhaV-PrlF toxin-antitoxin module
MSAPEKSESAGVVKISEDGVIVVPVEVREVLDIKNKPAYVRVGDISVAEVIDDDSEGGDGSE